ncbi:hypothetical protein CYY_004290 [Polysphondylium violaceum]|uniref:SAP domain-containing protein n=1 Tax=Polysphondylium violaceum TaxID=133409 RepID=A0A8J4PYG7_9MYCE|nr:hypothetical protein CYY_004290 [Polysphondylium violaceum]
MGKYKNSKFQRMRDEFEDGDYLDEYDYCWLEERNIPVDDMYDSKYDKYLDDSYEESNDESEYTDESDQEQESDEEPQKEGKKEPVEEEEEEEDEEEEEEEEDDEEEQEESDEDPQNENTKPKVNCAGGNIDSLSYRDLQALCKKHGIKANDKKDTLIDNLKKLNIA